MKIITLTLNPAFDTHCSTRIFKPCHENIAEIDSVEAGGKGVNISRALKNNGVENTAVVIVGKENKTEFLNQLHNDGLDVKVIETDGRIRENITVHPLDGMAETRICFDGFTLQKDLLRKVCDAIEEVDDKTVITMTGSIPKGITVNDVTTVLEGFRQKGAKIVIDSRSFSSDDLKAFKPWLTKPNNDEAKSYTGIPVDTTENALLAACKIHDLGVENAIISLGGDGAVLVCDEGTFVAKVPKIDVVSTIGAGDSMIAGFLDGYVKGLSKENCLKRAVSYGTAACLLSGTKPPLKCDVETIEKQVNVIKIYSKTDFQSTKKHR